MSDKSISLNKYISSTGICSRREADRMIEAGRVTINGTVAQKGNRVEEGDEVLLDGKPLRDKPASLYLALHKPPGITCTTDTNDKDNIIHFINYPQRIFPIGRLDKASTGLILLTNDGDVVNKILREENNHEKEYVVKVKEIITPVFLKKMATGVHILGTVTKRCRVEQVNNHVFKIILTQGMNRQIRRMCEALNYKVVSLKRIRVMHIELGNLKPGQWRELTKKEVAPLQNLPD